MGVDFKQWIVPHFWQKFVVVAVAILLMGFNLSFLIEARWGTDPCSFMNINLANKMGWTLGNWQLSLNVVMLIFTIVFKPRLIGFGTLLNMVLIGYTADFCCFIWRMVGLHSLIADPAHFPLRIAVFVFAIVFFVITAAIYMNADMGLSPYDAAIKIISGWIPRIPYFVLRICYDLAAIGIGFLASRFAPNGMQGHLLGSILMALTIGPAITTVGNFMKKHIAIFKD